MKVAHRMQTPPRKYMLIVAALALALTACSLSAASLLTTAPPPQPSPTSVTLFKLPVTSAASGLDTLNSYQVTTTLAFEGQRNGQTAAGTVEQTTQVDRPAALLRQVQTINAVIPNRKNSANHTEFVSTGNAVLIRQDEAAFWFEPKPGQQISGQEFGLLPLDSLLVLPQAVATAPRFDQLAGVNVQQYQFSEKDLASPELAFDRAEGTAWLTTPGNIVVQYQISGTVHALNPNAGAHLFEQAHLQLHYRLTLEPPPAATLPAPGEIIPPTLAQLPRLPDARLTAVYPTLLEYRSVISPVSATLYFHNSLPPLGWTEAISSVFNEKARLAYDRANERVSILITPAETPPQIKVVVELDQRQ